MKNVRKELERAKAEAEQLALHDPLTGLPNRTLFEDRLERTFVRTKRQEGKLYAVAFVDVDNFKVVNDSLGHEAGDELLVGICHRIGSCLRKGDTIARFGGDEFTLLFCGLKQAEDVRVVLDRIFESLKEPFEIGGERMFASVSIGAAVAESATHDPKDLIRDADTAMYQAKIKGRGRYEIFNRDMHLVATGALQDRKRTARCFG